MSKFIIIHNEEQTEIEADRVDLEQGVLVFYVFEGYLWGFWPNWRPIAGFKNFDWAYEVRVDEVV